MIALHAPTSEPTGRLPVVDWAQARLCATGYPALRNLRCEYEAGTLTLRGRLPTYYLKQIALAAVVCVEGVQRVLDRLEVHSPVARGPRRD